MEAERTSEIARHWINGEWVSSTKISDSLKGSGIGRARGARAAEEFQEIKTHFLAYKT